MKNIIPVFVGTAAIAAGVATAILNANNRFIGRTYLVPWFYALCVVLLITAVVVFYASRREDKLKPLIIPVRYGPSPLEGHARQIGGRLCKREGTPYSRAEIREGKHELGHQGLTVV